MTLELAAGILVDFLAAGGRLRAWPGPRWAMVGHGGRLVAETNEEATDERPCHLPAWAFTWLCFNLHTLDFEF